MLIPKGHERDPNPWLKVLSQEMRRRLAQKGGTFSDEEVLSQVEDLVLAEAALRRWLPAEKKQLIRLVFCSLRRELEILHDYARDPEVSEIMVNGTENIFVERAGRLVKLPIRFEDGGDLERIIQRLAAGVSREMNELHPIVDARLRDGSRINAVNANIAIEGPVLTIRKFNRDWMTMEDLIASDDISQQAADFLIRLVRCGYNMFVSGGTSSGKTTFLNVLSDSIPSRERVIVIEDSAELAIRNRENLVRMEAKQANAQGRGGVTMRDLIKTSLRMRPDRIIVGEVRGEEVVDMLAAMNTGHDGSLSTGHANSPQAMVGRLESLLLSASGFPLDAVRRQIADAIDIFVHLRRTAEGRRRVFEICEVEGLFQGNVRLNTLYHRKEGGPLLPTGKALIHREKWALHQEGGSR